MPQPNIVYVLSFVLHLDVLLLQLATKEPEWLFRQLLKSKDPFLEAVTIDFYT